VAQLHDRYMMMMKMTYDSVRWEVLYSILLGFGTPVNLVRLIKMCLIETYSTMRGGKYWSDVFPIRNGLKKGYALSPLLFDLAFEYAIRRVQRIFSGASDSSMCPGVDSASKNEYQDIPGVKTVGA